MLAGDQRQCHERRMGHHAVAGHRCCEPHRDTQDRTEQNIKARGAFTVSIADAAHIVEADYFGVESGNKVTDKFARSGLTASKAETVDPLSSTSFRSAWSAGSSSIRTMNTDAALSARWSMSLPMRALWGMGKLICLRSTPSHLTPTPTAIIKSTSV